MSQLKQEQDNLLQLVQVSKYPGLQTSLSKCGHQDFCEYRHNECKEKFLNSRTPTLDLQNKDFSHNFAHVTAPIYLVHSHNFTVTSVRNQRC